MHIYFSLITSLALATSPAIAGEMVPYEVEGETLKGYRATADTPKGTVILFPTWGGLSDYEMDRAEMLADLGYAVFAADHYAADARPQTFEEKQAGLKATVCDKERMWALLIAATEAAAPDADLPLFVMGYSMGGRITMEMAYSGLGSELGVDGYAIFSGRVTDPFERMLPLETPPIFVAHGDADAQIPASGLINFANDVELADTQAEIHTYPGAGHLFSGFGFPNYDAEADQQSWAALTQFLTRLSD